MRTPPVQVNQDSGQEYTLICPSCHEPYSYLHHGRVVVYERSEDETEVLRTVVCGKTVLTDLVTNETSGNPSSRRDGIVIEFGCELCHGVSELTIAQHKGVTFVEWRSIKQLDDREFDPLD